MWQTAAHLVDHVFRHMPVRQCVLSLPIALRVLLAAQPEPVTPVLQVLQVLQVVQVVQVVQRVLTRNLLEAAGLKADEGHGGAVTLIQRFGSAANLNIHLHCLVLDEVYRCDADAPTDDELHAKHVLGFVDESSACSGCGLRRAPHFGRQCLAG